MCHYVPAWANIAVCAEKECLCGTFVMALIWINAMVFVPVAQAPPKAGANLIDEFTSLFSPKVIVAGLPRKAFPGNM